MTREIARRLQAAEARIAAQPRSVEITDADWRNYYAHKAAMLVHVLGPSDGEPFARLYAAIAAGNAKGDSVQSYRSELHDRFDWAVRTATIAALGLPRVNEWLEVEVPDAVRAELVQSFDPALAERHPDLVHQPVRDEWFFTVSEGRLFRNRQLGKNGCEGRETVEVTGPEVAAFAPEAWAT